ncbi:MAG: hypothetical protein R6V44_18940 [Paracoccaceae bacterium]
MTFLIQGWKQRDRMRSGSSAKAFQGVAAGVDDGLEVREDAQAEEAFAQPEPDALHEVERWRTGRRRDERDRSEGP